MVRLILALVLLALPAAAQVRETPYLDLILDEPDARPYEGQMVLATIRGVYRRPIALEEMKLRRMTDFDWIRLGQDVWSEQQIDGRPARVVERRIAFFPMHAGELEILPIAHQLEFAGLGGERVREIVRSEPVRLTVRPKPVGAGEAWLPARAVEISDTWSTDASALEDGEVVQRRVIFRVLGAIPEMLPVQPPMRERWLITFAPPERRSMQLTPEGPVATAEWLWSLRPITGEPGVVPAVQIPYYDTTEDRAKIATIEAAPFGYASFSDNSLVRWRRDIGVGWAHLAAIGGAALIVLLVTARGRGLGERPLERLRQALARWRRRRALREAARAGSATRVRAHAAEILTRDRAMTEEGRLAVLRPVDRAIFGGAPDPGRADLRAVSAEVLRRTGR